MHRARTQNIISGKASNFLLQFCLHGSFKKECVWVFLLHFQALFWHFSVFFFVVFFSVNIHRLHGLLKFHCVLFWPMCSAWRASQHSGWVNVSYTRLLMRPETKERADTITGSVLRGSFTFYQATAGDMRGGMEAESKQRERAGETKTQQLKHVLSQTFLRTTYDLTGRVKHQWVVLKINSIILGTAGLYATCPAPNNRQSQQLL